MAGSHGQSSGSCKNSGGGRAWVEAPIDVVGLSLLGVIAHNRDEAPRSIPDMHVFSRHGAWLDDAELYAKAMVDARRRPHPEANLVNTNSWQVWGEIEPSHPGTRQSGNS